MTVRSNVEASVVAPSSPDSTSLWYNPVTQTMAKWNGSAWVVATGISSTSDPTTANDNTQGYLVGSQWINTSSKVLFICLDATTSAAVWRRTNADVQIFTASGTWTAPAGITNVEALIVGCGGGGGSGRRGAAATVRCGGGA